MITLQQGDCFELLKTIADNSVDLIITDPPYQMQMGGKKKSELGERLSNVRTELKNKDLMDFGRDKILELAKEFRRVQPKVNAFIFCSKDQMRYWYEAFTDINPYILVWIKTNPVPTFNNVLLPDVEYILYFRENGVEMFTNYNNASRYDMTAINVADKKLYNHPTIKPVPILERYISLASKEGDTVLDPFMGSGSTGVACVNKKRNFIGIEIDKEYFTTATNRINGVLKNQADSLI